MNDYIFSIYKEKGILLTNKNLKLFINQLISNYFDMYIFNRVYLSDNMNIEHTL